jgi:hypothetical protein
LSGVLFNLSDNYCVFGDLVERITLLVKKSGLGDLIGLGLFSL